MCVAQPVTVSWRPLQEVFLTKHHLAIALEYADGGDLSEFIDERAQQGVRPEPAIHLPPRRPDC